MSSKRSYGDRCGVARGLDLVGERWALLVVRELLLGPKRFTDLRAGLPHIGPDVLSQRLRELEAAGVLRRGKLAPPAAARIYELTDWGAQLEPVVLGLGRWGTRAPFPDAGGVFSADSAVLALKTLFTPSAAGGLHARYQLRLGEHSFRAGVTQNRLEISRGELSGADATIQTDPTTLAGVLWHGRGLAQAVRSGDLELQGDRAAAERFLELFAIGNVG